METRRFETTGFEDDLFYPGRQFSIQLCRLENHNCYCRNSEIANSGIMDINNDNSIRVRKNKFGGEEKKIHGDKIANPTVTEKSTIYPTGSKRSANTAERLKSCGRSRTQKMSQNICPFCSKIIKGKKLGRHLRVHTQEKPFVCQVCNLGFADSSDLKRHEIVHSGEKPYICQICSKGFTQQSSLKVHKRRHTGEKPYTCSMCSKQFARKGDLKMHIRVHTGEKPYQCPLCDKFFIQLTHQKRHLKNHRI